MNTPVKLQAPLSAEDIERLKIGDRVLLSGPLYTARDAAHKRLAAAIQKGEKLPFELEGQIIYYVGPAPPKPGMAVGAAGPTSSYRMDPYTPLLLQNGLKGVIGKGQRGKDVIQALRENRAVYFAATGGAGALIAKAITASEIIAYEDLGPEAIRKFTVSDFPVIVANDCHGNDLYLEGRGRFEVRK